VRRVFLGWGSSSGSGSCSGFTPEGILILQYCSTILVKKIVTSNYLTGITTMAPAGRQGYPTAGRPGYPRATILGTPKGDRFDHNCVVINKGLQLISELSVF